MQSTNNFNQKLGRAIRQRRTAYKLTQAQLGKALGVSTQQIQKYETGKNRISAETLFRLSTLLRCSVNSLIQAAQDEAPPLKHDIAAEGWQLMRDYHAIKRQDIRRLLEAFTKALAE